MRKRRKINLFGFPGLNDKATHDIFQCLDRGIQGSGRGRASFQVAVPAKSEEMAPQIQANTVHRDAVEETKNELIDL